MNSKRDVPYKKTNCNDFVSFGFSSECCPTQTLLNALINLLPLSLINPNNPALRPDMMNLFNQFFVFLNSLIPSPETYFLKQLFQVILNLLQAPTFKQLFGAFASFSFPLIVDPTTLQLLLNILTQLIGAGPMSGPTGITGSLQPSVLFFGSCITTVSNGGLFTFNNSPVLAGAPSYSNNVAQNFNYHSSNWYLPSKLSSKC
ncbi:hypothetical protein [Bacillus cereus]|uniref:hypothetical protein n=1 Tax=Bacillus cereus TaxID=1396 RepID=UPI0012FBFAE8|nr:hypothetical protein [Bacillus cereus]